MGAYKGPGCKSKELKFRIIKQGEPFNNDKPYLIQAYHNWNSIFRRRDWWHIDIGECVLSENVYYLGSGPFEFAKLEDAEHVYNEIINSKCLSTRSINLILEPEARLTEEEHLEIINASIYQCPPDITIKESK